MRSLVLSLLVLLSACAGGGSSEPSIPFIAIEGDSLADSAYTTWPAKLAAQYPGTYSNNAKGGRHAAESLAAYALTGGDVFILIVGTNDVQQGIEGIPQTFANIRATWAKARADGFRVIAATVANARDFQAVPAGTALPYREQLNALIRGASSEYDALIELDKLLPDQDDPAAYIDQVHFADGGSTVVAAAMLNAIRPTRK
jgi:lysophospholipase L1-like esterase